MIMKTPCRRIVWLVLVAAFLTSKSGRVEATVSEAWSALWTNDTARAGTLFQAAIDDDDDDADSWRGLLLTQLLTGDDEQLGETLHRYAKCMRGDPGDWYVLETINSLVGRDSRKFFSTLHDFAERQSRMDDLAPADRRASLTSRLNWAMACGDLGDSRETADELGHISPWVLLGPFDNTSGSGHGKMHIPSWHPSAQTFSGKYNQQIQWFIPKVTALDGSIYPSRYFYNNEETTAYLRTVVNVDESDRYLLSLSHDGDLQLWIDGALLFEGDRRNSGHEVAHWDIHLDAGPHLIAAKVSNRQEESRLGVALSFLDGRPAGFSVEPAQGFMIAPEKPELDAVFVETPHATRLALLAEEAFVSGQNREQVFWALRQSLHTQTPDSTMNLCRRIEARFPESAALLTACGLAYASLGKEDDTLRILSVAQDLDPTLVLARVVRIAVNVEKERYETALAACDSVLDAAPRCTWAMKLKAKTLQARHDLDGFESYGRYLVSAMRDSPLGYENLAAWADERGLLEEARKYEREAARRRPPMHGYAKTYYEQLRRGDYGDAVDVIEELLEYLPDAAFLHVALCQAYLAQSDFFEAMDLVDEALESFPQSVELLYFLAVFAEHDAYRYDDAGRDKASAIDALGKAINIAPGDFNLRDKRRTLSGRNSYREYLPEPDLDEVLGFRVEPGNYADARAVVLRESKRRLFFEDDVSLVDYFLAVQVLTAAGVEAWKEYETGLPASRLTVIESKTIKLGGLAHSATLYGSRVHFENLEPGDVIVLHYQSVLFQGGALTGQAWDRHVFAFADPCLESRFELIAHNELQIDHALHNAEAHGKPVETRTDTLAEGFVAHSWVLRDIDGLFFEVNATNQLSYLAWLDLTTIPSWQSIASWYCDLAAGQAEASWSIREKASALCAGAKTRDEIIEHIYRFVAQKINYVFSPFYMSAHVPRQADEVLDTRFGDCKDKSCLMIALLNAAGVDGARFALVDSWGSRSVAYLPSPRFDHAVVCLPDQDGGYRWFDPTIKYGTSRQIPGSLAGCMALIADPQVDRLVTVGVDDVEDYPSSVQSEGTVMADGAVRLHRRVVDTDMNRTAQRRASLEHLTERELRESVIENLAEAYPGAEIDSLTVLHRAEIDSALVFDYSFRAPMVFQDTGSFLIGRIPWEYGLSTQFSRIVAKAERRSPIDLHRLRSCEIESVALMIPAGYEVVEVPADQQLAFAECRYITRYELRDQRLEAHLKIVFDGDRVPVTDYVEFKAFLESALQYQKSPLLLKKAG